MKKWVIGIIVSLSVSFMIGISSVKATINTTFGVFPDVPYNSEYIEEKIMIIRLKNSPYLTYLFVPKVRNGATCNFDHFYTNFNNNMNVGLYPYSTNCVYDRYKLVNNVWGDLQANNQGALGYEIFSYAPSDFDFATADITFNKTPSTQPGTVYIQRNYNMISLFKVAFEQGEVLMSNYNNLSANLVSYYLEPTFDDFNPEDYKFCYISTGGGFRDNPTCFELTYIEAGINYNNNIYHYYYNLPLFYNINLGFIIYDNEDNIIQQDNINAYLSVLSSLEGYTIYDFTNYEYANMSNINSGLFALSPDLADNVDIYVVDISSGNKTNFFTSTYYIDNDSYYDSVGNRWISFNFNNASVYLEIINKVNDITDFWSYADNYHLYMYFPNSAYIHLSGSPNIEDNQDNPVNQQSYMDSNGDIHYVDNPIKSDFSDTSGFMSHFNSYFGQYTDSTGLTSIIIAPLNLISSLSSSTCEPLNVPLPYVNSNLTLPCMTQVYKFYFPLFYDMYEIVTYGLVSYHILVYMLYIIKKAKDPKNDEIEVMDL